MTTKIPGRDGSVTLISDSYAPFGTIQPGPTVAEDPSKWEIRWLDEADIQRRYRWTSEQIDDAIALVTFPKPYVSTTTQFGSFQLKRTRRWRENDLSKWDERIASLGLVRSK